MSMARAADKGRSIEFSRNRSGGSTNINQLPPKKDGLQDFESDLLKPFQVMTPKGSMDGVVAPPVRPSAPSISSKKARELIRKKKEWIYDTDPEMPKSSELEEFLNTPDYTEDGKDKKKMSPLDKYYDFLENRRRTGVRNGEKPNDKENSLARLRREANGIPDDSSDEESDTAKKDEKDDRAGFKSILKPDLSSNPFSPKKGSGAFSDVFGLERYQPTADQEKEHREYMKQYQQLWTPNAGLGSLQPSPAPVVNPLADVTKTPPWLASDPFAPKAPPTQIAPAIPQVPGTFGDLKTFTQPAFTPPLVQDTPKTLFPTTTSPFEAPRRKF